METLADGLQYCGVVPATKTTDALLVVGDLSLMLQSRFWMEPVSHLTRAWTLCSSSSGATSCTFPLIDLTNTTLGDIKPERFGFLIRQGV